MSKSEASSQIPSLTGIRGLGALWVFSNHALFGLCQILNLSWERFSLFFHGYYGVDLFFVLSGFIIAHVHFGDFAEGSLKKFKNFMILRAFRIYPLHMAVMLAMVPLVLLFPAWTTFEVVNSELPHEFELGTYITSFFLVQTWGYWQGFSWNGTSWTLSAELLAYFLFPFIVLFIRRIKMPWLNLAMGAGLLLLLGGLLGKAHLLEINAAHFAGIARALLGFTAGCFLNQFFRMSGRTFTGPWACLGSIALIAAALSFAPLRPLIYLGLGLLVLSLAYMPVFFGRVVGTGPVLWLGKISFSFYLTHWLVLHLVEWRVDPHLDDWSLRLRAAYFAAAVVLIFLTATASYHWIEKPSHRLGRRLAGRG